MEDFMDEKKEHKKWVIQCIFLIAVLIFILQRFSLIMGVLKSIWGFSFPLILGGIMAYILNLLMSKLEKIYFPNSDKKVVKKSRRVVCMTLSIFIVVGILVLVIQLVVPELARNLFNYATNGVSGILNSTLSFVVLLVGGVVNFFIALIFALYILISKEKLLIQIKKICKAYLSDKVRNRIEDICYIANSTFSSFIIGQITEAVILGGLCAIGMMILKLPYAGMTGAFIGVTALIPIVGAYLGAGVGAFMILTKDPMQVIIFLIFIVILQQVEGNLIYPKVVGSSIGLPGLWVLAAVTIGGGIGGIMGMLWSVPIAATAYKLVRKDVNQRVERKKQKELALKEEQRKKEQQKEEKRERKK